LGNQTEPVPNKAIPEKSHTRNWPSCRHPEHKDVARQLLQAFMALGFRQSLPEQALPE